MRARSVEVRLVVSTRPPFLPLQLLPPRKRPRQLFLDRGMPRLQRLHLARPVAIQHWIGEPAGDFLLLPFQRFESSRQFGELALFLVAELAFALRAPAWFKHPGLPLCSFGRRGLCASRPHALPVAVAAGIFLPFPSAFARDGLGHDVVEEFAVVAYQ